MTKIDLDTSPLQAAREWRGASLVSVAMNCGLPVAQAEALETGDLDAFDSVDEMIAAAVVYGAAMGIGRDEATALLDRTVRREALIADVPDAEIGATVPQRPNDSFSSAVQERSARIAGAALIATPPLEVDAVDLLDVDSEDVAAAADADSDADADADSVPVHVPLDEPVAPAALDEDLPAVPEDPAGPTPEQAVAASGELHLDEAFGPDAPWEPSGSTGELEAWVDDYDDYDSPVAARSVAAGGMLARVGSGSHAALERIIGSDRADAVADRTRELTVRATELARQGREQLRRSEHATLIVAIGVGAVLIAIVVALGGALGGDDPIDPAGENATKAAATQAEQAANGEAAAAAKPAAAKPMIAPTKLTVDVYNAGSQKGKAKTVADKIRGFNYRIGEVTNAKTDYASSRIIHPRSMAREARLLGRRTGITTLHVAPGSSRRITVIVT